MEKEVESLKNGTFSRIVFYMREVAHVRGKQVQIALNEDNRKHALVAFIQGEIMLILSSLLFGLVAAIILFIVWLGFLFIYGMFAGIGTAGGGANIGGWTTLIYPIAVGLVILLVLYLSNKEFIRVIRGDIECSPDVLKPDPEELE